MSTSHVFVSGGSRGIGKAIALEFLQAGYRVSLCGRNEQRLRDLARDHQQLNTFVADVSLAKDVRELADRIGREVAPVDVVVNNAGFFRASSLMDESDAAFDDMMRGNVYSAFYLTKALLPQLRKSSNPAIINICSVASIRGYPTGGSYSAAKHALLGFTRSLREELRPLGIPVIGIVPGATYTDSWVTSTYPETRFMQPKDIAEVALLAHRLSGRAVLEEIVMRPPLGDIS